MAEDKKPRFSRMFKRKSGDEAGEPGDGDDILELEVVDDTGFQSEPFVPYEGGAGIAFDELDEPSFESFAPPEVVGGLGDGLDEPSFESFAPPEHTVKDGDEGYWEDPPQTGPDVSPFAAFDEEEGDSWWNGPSEPSKNPYAELMNLSEEGEEEVGSSPDEYSREYEVPSIGTPSREELKELREAFAAKEEEALPGDGSSPEPVYLEPKTVEPEYLEPEYVEPEYLEPEPPEADYLIPESEDESLDPMRLEFDESVLESDDLEPEGSSAESAEFSQDLGYVPESAVPEVTVIGGPFPSFDEDETPQESGDEGESWNREALEQILPVGDDDDRLPPEEDVWSALANAHSGGVGADVDELYAATTREYQGLAEEIERSKETEFEQQAVAASIPGLDTGLIGFEDVTGAARTPGVEFEALEQQRSSDLALRFGTGLILMSVLAGALMLGGGVFAGFVTIVMLMGLGEFYAAVRKSGYRPVAAFGFLGVVFGAVGSYTSGPYAIAGGSILTLVLVAVFFTVMNRQAPLENAAVTVLGAAWVGMLSFAIVICGIDDSIGKLVLIVVLVAAVDTGAYFVGKLFGKHHLAPNVSPKKTWEGLMGGVILTFLITGFVVTLPAFEYLSLAQGLFLAAAVCVLAPLGDAFESVVKRALNVKDMGSILPGHGGMLDRVDALLFVAPAAFAFFNILGLL